MAQAVFHNEKVHKDPESAKELRYFSFIEAQKASCTGCGQCCRSWNISIEEDRAKAVDEFFKSKGLMDQDAKLFEKKKRKTGPDEEIEETYIILKEGGVCPFLEDDNKCGIHRHMGYEAKGTTCQMFPKQPLYVSGIGGFDGYFFSSNYMLDLLFSEKPLSMISIGEDIEKEERKVSFPGSPLTPGDVLVMLRAFSPMVHQEPEAWKVAVAWSQFNLECVKRAQAGDAPANWNSAQAERILKEAFAPSLEQDVQASVQIDLIQLIVTESFTDELGGGIILPAISKLYLDRNGQPMTKPNLIYFHRLNRQQWPKLKDDFDRVYRRFIALKNYGLTYIVFNGLVNAHWLSLFHMALSRLVAMILLEQNPSMTPTEALRQTIFGLERDFLHNGVRMKELCEGEMKDFLSRPMTAVLLGKVPTA